MTTKLKQLSETIRIVVHGEKDTESFLSAAVEDVTELFHKVDGLHREACRLAAAGVMIGGAADEAAAAVRRWAVVREQVAEVGQLLLSVSPALFGTNASVFTIAARSGATEKRLAEWEQEWLRSEVVTVLAGDKQ